ncbi:COX15/CtaA family protein [Methylicorpusculum oleiharenae]|uniref:COX15/CtaA family protein n=1 Tax=Methylicorpusculum oleiharenae TaxID=1338687 RepID=UPI00135ABD6E|nr:COX15/CtaA family protein [Methylicorpusculum oleiharenae]MCD2452699.1 COX15/CtaA family protein [Methylicorpusculum oleiharenae]
MTDTHSFKSFRRLGTITIIAVYFLILVGGIVRASGAGMGCPDWPTCFGSWVPPTDVSQLPDNYQTLYAERGYKNTTFNPVKTWTEYLNRLSGVTIGILILATAWASRIYLRTDKTVFYLSCSVVLIVGFQGWLGSAVVASNLKPLIITLHMMLALFIVALLIYVIARSQHDTLQTLSIDQLPPQFRTVIKVAMGMTLVQISMGTQVREAVDLIANQHSYIDRQFWRNDLPVIFYVHRSFSSVILFTNLWLGWKLFKLTGNNRALQQLGILLTSCVVIAILAGVSLDRLGFPAFAQPIHLLMANLIFGVQFLIYICHKYASESQATPLTHDSFRNQIDV